MPLLDKRFSDAGNLGELARMLDDHFFREEVSIDDRHPNALFPLEIGGPPGLSVGSLVRISDDRYVVLADALASTPIPASDVIVAVRGLNSYIIAPFAVLDVPALHQGGSGLREIWLSAGGGFTSSAPTAGLYQKVGVGIEKVSENTQKIRFHPDPGMGFSF